jgi:hypothetical protein
MSNCSNAAWLFDHLVGAGEEGWGRVPEPIVLAVFKLMTNLLLHRQIG